MGRSNSSTRAGTFNSDGSLNISIVTGYDSTNDVLKVESNGQNYYDLLPSPLLVPAGGTVTIGAGSNYNISATGSWILHTLIKRARAMQIYGNFSQNTEVKPYFAPIDNPDQNTPEYINYNTSTDSAWAFVDKSGGSVAVGNIPAASKILPIAANALKFYIKNNGAVDETITFFIRLIF